MSLRKDKITERQEIFDCIENYIAEDINTLIEDKPINMGTRIVPSFDQYELYKELLKKIDKEEDYQQKKQQRKMLVKWVSACAVMLLFLNVGYYFFADINFQPTYREITTAKGEKILVLLPDGSRVWLNADSKLTYPEQFARRQRDVKLDGEAYFEVSKNITSSFHVFADNLEVKVTGTSFNVSAYSASEMIRVTLDEGTISVGEASKKYTLQEMLPGQTAIYDKENHTCNIEENRFYKEASSWKNNQLVFRNASLQEVVNVLSRQFNLEFEIRNEGVKSFTYNFVGRGSDLSNVIEVMESITPVKFKKLSVDKYIIE